MSVVRVISEVRAVPGCEDAVREALTHLLEATKIGEPTCLGYELFEDPSEPERFVMIETWADERAAMEHLATPHVQSVVMHTAAMLACAPTKRVVRRVA